MRRRIRSCDRRSAGPASLLAMFLVALPAARAVAEDDGTKAYASDAKPGIEERLGECIPLDLRFTDADGTPVVLGDVIRRPTILTLVYLRCPNICSPLLHELAATIDKLDLEPGIDFDVLTVSFDITDNADLASTARKNLLSTMKRTMPPESWRFLTGEAGEISRLTDATGFRFKQEKEDFSHAGTVIFLAPDGKIVRYLGGLSLLPADVKLALIDAKEGRARSFMQKLQRLCYAYDSEGKTYIFMVNRVILAVSVLIVGGFLAFLLLKGRKSGSRDGKVEASA